MAEQPDRADGGESAESRPPLERASLEQVPLEQWPEDEGGAPHARPEFPSILRLLMRAAPRVILAVVLAFLYTASEGPTAMALMLSWVLVVGSMLLPGWRRYVETGKRHKPGPAETLVEADRPAAVEHEDGDEDGIDPRDAWELPTELPDEPGAPADPHKQRPDGN
jgi:hypothetical protein